MPLASRERNITIRIRKGMNIPLAGAAIGKVQSGRPVSGVALVGPDYVGLSGKFQIGEGDRVILGQTLFTNR